MRALGPDVLSLLRLIRYEKMRRRKRVALEVVKSNQNVAHVN
jgi:hypothetical protein